MGCAEMIDAYVLMGIKVMNVKLNQNVRIIAATGVIAKVMANANVIQVYKKYILLRLWRKIM